MSECLIYQLKLGRTMVRITSSFTTTPEPIHRLAAWTVRRLCTSGSVARAFGMNTATSRTPTGGSFCTPFPTLLL
jgi:hypothetical protein